MSKIQKLRRFFQFGYILIAKYYWGYPLCILLENQVLYQLVFYKTLIQKIKILEKKECTVQVEILILKKVFEEYRQEHQNLLTLQGVQAM